MQEQLQREPPTEDPGMWKQISVLLGPAVPFLWISFSGFLITSFYQIVQTIYNFFMRKVYCSMTLRSNDDMYGVLQKYLTEKGFLSGGSLTQMKAQIKKKEFVWWWSRAKKKT